MEKQFFWGGVKIVFFFFFAVLSGTEKKVRVEFCMRTQKKRFGLKPRLMEYKKKKKEALLINLKLNV